MELDFSLKELEELSSEFLDCYNTYKNSLDSLKKITDEVSLSWQSPETHTYDEFKNSFLQKYSKLLETEKMMFQIIQILEAKKQDLENASEKVIQSFE